MFITSWEKTEDKRRDKAKTAKDVDTKYYLLQVLDIHHMKENQSSIFIVYTIKIYSLDAYK